MNKTAKLFTHHYYRSVYFWLFLLLMGYSLSGFFILPRILKNTLIEQVQLNLGWNTTIKNIAFNPFLLRLDIEELSIENKLKRPQLSFTKLSIDFELRSLFEGAFSFADVRLIDPAIHLIIDKKGNNNFQQALINNEKSQKSEDENNKKQIIPPLLFDLIQLKNGQLSIDDHRVNKRLSFKILPINFTLHDFSTRKDTKGNYKLALSIAPGESIDWQGDISLQPFSSQGFLTLKGIQAAKFWPYIQEFMPYKLQHSEIDLKTLYKVKSQDDRLQLQLKNSFITLKNIELADKKQQKTFTKIKQILIGPFRYDLEKQILDIKKIKIDALDLQLTRNKKGQLTLLDAFKQKTKTDKSKIQTTKSNFQWNIDEIVLQNSHLKFNDEKPKNKINIRDITLNMSDLSQDLSQKSTFHLSYLIEKSKKSYITGQLNLAPFKLKADLSFNALHLPLIQPYLASIAHVNLKSGKLWLSGALALQQDKNAKISGKFKGKIKINDFNMSDKKYNKRLIGWQSINVESIQLDFQPLRINIDTIDIQSPYLRLIVDAKRHLNINELLISSSLPNKKTNRRKSTPLPLAIKKIIIKNGNGYFADLSLLPAFSTRIEKINGDIHGMSSEHLSRANINIKGRIDEYGKMQIQGEMNPLSNDLYTNIKLDFSNIELTTFTPYSGRYAGYVIDKGKLNLKLKYKIVKRKLDASNRLILEQFELGDAVNSDEAVDLPIKLALALFKDKDGIIDINLPTKGNLDSPDFKISGLVMSALKNVFLKAVSSPFALFSTIIGADAEQLSHIDFRLGESKLNDRQNENLKNIADILKKRPQLILEVRVNIDVKKETKTLKMQILNKKLRTENFYNEDIEDKIDILEDLLSVADASDSIDEIESQLEKNDLAKSTKLIQQQKYKEALYAHLVNIQKVNSLALTELAQARIRILKAQLLQHYAVQNKQLFMLHPSFKGVAKNGKISTLFSLTGQ
ncbi:hypothetical protein PCNPT3_05835 [Psychromonas sp. CNPT3]|uniref:DUF748 domain-containing protein n=1 Tax=Psychromonas sp. CNPT3 TaxID=314282 RepID=UPI0002C15476|nr:DUF748 domain-containing protein [Psychromonas sp. CNPT3]AGH81109.1 hypothetical protein PCNPT3_05835 [Psychromonas sp. CNPT3]